MSLRDLASSLMYAQLSKPKLCLLDRSHGPDLAKNARGYLTEFLPQNLCNPESPNQAQIQIVAYFMASTIYMDFAKRRSRWRYLLDEEPFNDWSIHDRYANRSHFTQPNVEPHRAAACRICNMVDRANTDLMP